MTVQHHAPARIHHPVTLRAVLAIGTTTGRAPRGPNRSPTHTQPEVEESDSHVGSSVHEA